MSTPLAEWLESPEVKKFQAMPQEEASHRFFFRDPCRTMWVDHKLFGSPADGVLTLQGRFDPEDDLIDVKGQDCSVNSLLGPRAIDTPALVLGIFMTAADVHINRLPTSALLTTMTLPSIRTMNQPMLFAERGLLDSGLIRKGTFGFMASNERRLNVCWCSGMNYTYYVVQIADSDVDCIVSMNPARTASFLQNERFGQIRWGSMCVLIMPLDNRYRFKPTQPIGQHVECCTDALVRVERV